MITKFRDIDDNLDIVTISLYNYSSVEDLEKFYLLMNDTVSDVFMFCTGPEPVSQKKVLYKKLVKAIATFKARNRMLYNNILDTAENNSMFFQLDRLAKVWRDKQ